jgi:hypothetical protein
LSAMANAFVADEKRPAGTLPAGALRDARDYRRRGSMSLLSQPRR